MGGVLKGKEQIDREMRRSWRKRKTWSKYIVCKKNAIKKPLSLSWAKLISRNEVELHSRKSLWPTQDVGLNPTAQKSWWPFTQAEKQPLCLQQQATNGQVLPLAPQVEPETLRLPTHAANIQKGEMTGFSYVQFILEYVSWSRWKHFNYEPGKQFQAPSTLVSGM